MALRAGDLRTRLQLQKATVAKSRLRENVRTWATTATIRAKLEFPPGRQAEESEARRFEQPVTISIRYRSDVDGVSTRFKRGTEIYEIQAVVDPDQRRRELRITGLVRMHADTEAVVPAAGAP